MNAWNVNGSWCCSGYGYNLNSAQETDLTNNDWLVTVYMRDLYTGTSDTGYGPNSLGGAVTIGVDGLRYSIDLHSDGNGDQILAADPFAAGPTYTIQGLGEDYAEIQMAYNAATHTVDYYVNGQEVLSGFAGYTNYYFNGLDFGGQDSNYNFIELQSDTTIGTPTVPEPATCATFGFGSLFLLTMVGRGCKRRSISNGTALLLARTKNN